MGNTNFSIILPRLLFTRAHGAELVAKAIRERLGVVGCTVNDRNDVIVRDQSNNKDYKASPRPTWVSRAELIIGFWIGLQDHPASGLSSWHNAYIFLCRRTGESVEIKQRKPHSLWTTMVRITKV